MAAGEYVSVHSQADAERTLATIRFGDHHPPHRIRSVCLRDQFRAQARQPCFQALLLDASKRHPIHTRCTCIDAGEPIGVDQDVTGSPGAVARRNVSTILRQPSVEFKLGCLAFSAVD